jgi:C4-type Zn-finger protein
MEKNSCPICGEKLTIVNQRSDVNQFGVLEEEIECANCELYKGVFFYGTVEVTIDGEKVGWSQYSNNDKELMEKLNELVSRAQKKYEEGQ